MADVTWQIDEIRYLVLPEYTEVYAFISVSNFLDCPHLIPGWHYKRFPANMTLLEILQDHKKHEDILFWPEVKPPERFYKTRLERLNQSLASTSDPSLREALKMLIESEQMTQERLSHE